MDGRWRAALAEGAAGAMRALIVQMLVGAFGGGAVLHLTGLSVPPLLFSSVLITTALLGSLGFGAYSFWRSYHRDDPPGP